MQNTQETKSILTMNGEQAKLELEAIKKKAENLRDEYLRLNKAQLDYVDANGKKDPEIEKQLKKINNQIKANASETKRLQNETFDLKKVLDDLSGSSIKELDKAYYKLRAQLRSGDVERNSKEWKEMVSQMKRVKEEQNLLNKEMNVGESKFSRIAERMGIQIGIAGAAYAAWSLVTSSISKIMEFSKAVSMLQAITGASGKDLNYLKTQAKDLGREYGMSATEIVTSMKLVGSAKPELLNNVKALSAMTSAVLTLSKATGMDAVETTEGLTTIMNQFGLSAGEATRLINVLAAASKYGEVEVGYLKESISKVGTVAKSAGLSVEQTASAMELFGSKGVKAETAGNGFKRVLVELQADTKNYKNGIFDLNLAIDNNQKIANNNIALQKKFGLEFFNIAQILLQGKKRFNELTGQITGTNEAFNAAAIATDNLSGDVDKLKSSWDVFILSLDDGQGPIARAIRGLVSFSKSFIDAMSYLSKSDAQNTDDGRTKMSNSRLDTFKQTIAKNPDKISSVNDEINHEKEIVKAMKAKIELIKEEVKVEKEKWGILGKDRSIVVDGEKNIKNITGAIDVTNRYINALGGLRQELKTKTDAPKPIEDTEEEKLKKALEAIEMNQLKEQNIFKKQRSENKINEEAYASEMLRIEVKFIKQKQNLYTSDSKEYIEYQSKLYDIGITKTKTANEMHIKSIEDSYKSIQDATNQYENTERERLQGELQDKTKTQEQYNAAILALEETLAESRLNNASNYAELIGDATFNSEADKKKAVTAANAAVTAADGVYQKAKEKRSKGGLKEEKDNLAEIARIRQTLGLDQEKLGYMKSLKALKEKLNKEKVAIIDQEEYIAAFKKKKAVEYAQIAVQITDGIAGAIQASNQTETDSLNAEKQKQLTIAGNNAAAIDAVNKEFAQKELDLKKKQADANMAIQIAQAIAAGALGVANIWAVDGINPILAGILTALEVVTVGMQISSIVAQRDAIKSTSIGYADGGFTPPGDKYKPAGIVHAGEFVANQEAVRSAPLRKIFNLVDYAQRTNTVARIDDEAIARALSMKQGYAGGGYVQPAAAASQILNVDMSAVVATMEQTNAVNAALLRELQAGINAKYTISGNSGVKKGLEEYEKLLKNAQR